MSEAFPFKADTLSGEVVSEAVHYDNAAWLKLKFESGRILEVTTSGYDMLDVKDTPGNPKAPVTTTDKPSPLAARLIALQWQSSLFGKGVGSTLPEICMALRIGVNGSGDEWDPTFIRQAVEMLKARLQTWLPSTSRDERVDEAVRLLVQATIDEVEGYTWWTEELARR